MSQEIDLSKKLSKDDRAYLKSRGRYWEIEANDVTFGVAEPGADVVRGADEPDPGPDGSVGAAKPMADAQHASEEDKISKDEVNELTVEELKGELEYRDETPEGNKPELQKQLLKVLRTRGELKE